jgi:NAD(P)-dependent dehydrogenase (short-subunit alcohol dehydrogenase family)
VSPFAHYPSLRDRVVLVTGGGTGIGASIVEHFYEQGARVAFLDIQEAPSRELTERFAENGTPVPLFLATDLRDIDALRDAVARVEGELGPITVLVNNAANDERHRVQDVTPEYWNDRLAVNLNHQFFAAQAVRDQMRAAGGGSIVNMGSIAWKIGLEGLPGYITSKAAISGMTRGLAREFGPDNIRVNTVLPGSVQTARQLELWLTEEEIAEILELQCLKQPLFPPDVARMVLFLAADDSRMCTSQDFIVDGGWV